MRDQPSVRVRPIPILLGGWGDERGQIPALGPSLALRSNTPHLVARSALHPSAYPRALEEVRARLLLSRRTYAGCRAVARRKPAWPSAVFCQLERSQMPYNMASSSLALGPLGRTARSLRCPARGMLSPLDPRYSWHKHRTCAAASRSAPGAADTGHARHLRIRTSHPLPTTTKGAHWEGCASSSEPCIMRFRMELRIALAWPIVGFAFSSAKAPVVSLTVVPRPTRQ